MKKATALGLLALCSLVVAGCAADAGSGEDVGQSADALRSTGPGLPVGTDPVGSKPTNPTNPTNPIRPIGPVEPIDPGNPIYAPIPVTAPIAYGVDQTETTTSSVSLWWNEPGGNGQTILYRQLYDLAGNTVGDLAPIAWWSSLAQGTMTYVDSAAGIGPDSQVGYSIVEIANGYDACEYTQGGQTCAGTPVFDAYTPDPVAWDATRVQLRLAVSDAISGSSTLHVRAELGTYDATWINSTQGDFQAGSDITYDLSTSNVEGASAPGIDTRSDIQYVDLWTPDSGGICVSEIDLLVDDTTTFHETFPGGCQWVGNGGGEITVPFAALRSSAEWQGYAPEQFIAGLTPPLTFVGFDSAGLTAVLDSAVGDVLKDAIPSPPDGSSAGLGAPTTVTRTDATHLHVQQNLVNLTGSWDGISLGTFSASPSYDLVIHHADSTCSGWCLDVENISGNVGYSSGVLQVLLDIVTAGIVPLIDDVASSKLQSALSRTQLALQNPELPGVGYCFAPATPSAKDPGPVFPSFSQDGTPVPFDEGSLTVCFAVSN